MWVIWLGIWIYNNRGFNVEKSIGSSQFGGSYIPVFLQFLKITTRFE